jgi:hypothetical protein
LAFGRSMSDESEFLRSRCSDNLTFSGELAKISSWAAGSLLVRLGTGGALRLCSCDRDDRCVGGPFGRSISCLVDTEDSVCVRAGGRGLSSLSSRVKASYYC